MKLRSDSLHHLQALMLCHLCGFGVVSVGLIYDFIKRLLESFTPMDIELLVSVLTRAFTCKGCTS